LHCSKHPLNGTNLKQQIFEEDSIYRLPFPDPEAIFEFDKIFHEEIKQKAL